jgi:hypothetical protein
MTETKVQTEAIARYIHEESLELGLMPKSWQTHIQEGSPTYGRGWRIAAVCPKTGAHFNHPATASGGDYLGWSRTEANGQLRRIMQGLTFMKLSKKAARGRYGRK